MMLRGISVCGLGKLGAPIAAAFAASRVPTIGLDTDEKKVKLINEYQAPIVEPNLAEYMEDSILRSNLRATTSVEEAVRLSDACLFVTPTPSLPDGSFDHTLLLNAIKSVAREAADQHRRKYLFIINSTVMPGFLEQRVAPELRRWLHDYGYGLVYKPEFIALGTVIRDLLYPDLLLIGEDSYEAGAKTEALYRDLVLHDCQSRHMKLVEAELAKISLNVAVTMKISYANQVANVARRLTADPVKVLGAIGLDHRIGHAALRPGLPFGGPCFPRDNRMFQYVAKQIGERVPLSEATDTVNKRLLHSVLVSVSEHGPIGILGMAYKPGTHITDDSPGFFWMRALGGLGRTVKTHDPLSGHSHTLDEVCACPTVIVACSCAEYKRITVRPKACVIDLSGETQVEYAEVKEEQLQGAAD